MNRLMLTGLLSLNVFAIPTFANAHAAPLVGGSVQVYAVDNPDLARHRTEITGKLQYVIRHWHTKELIMICDQLPQTLSRSWSIGYGITVGGKTIDVDFASNELRQLADKLSGKQVMVRGHDAGDKIVVDRLTALPDEAIFVRIRGFIVFYTLEIYPPIDVYKVQADGQTYHLHFANDELRQLAASLAGRRVFLTGTLKSGIIMVRELKADDTASATERVVLRGKLTWHDPHPDQPHFAIYPPMHGVVQLDVNGRKFALSLTREQRVAAWKLMGQEVRVTGTMENGTVRVSQIQSTEPSIQWTIDVRGVLTYMNIAPAIRLLIDEEGPYPVCMEWMISTKGQTYTLRFATPELEARARKLIDKPVIITGDFDGNVVTVRTIEADEATSIEKKPNGK